MKKIQKRLCLVLPLFCLCLTLIAATGCCKAKKCPLRKSSENMVGGPCAYEKIPGTARIVSVTSPDPGAYNCPNQPKKVVFDFLPEDSGKKIRFDNFSNTGRTLTLPGGLNPPANWLRSQDIVPGAEFACQRREITKGTCTPVLFDIQGLDFNAGLAQCRQNTR